MNNIGRWCGRGEKKFRILRIRQNAEIIFNINKIFSVAIIENSNFKIVLIELLWIPYGDIWSNVRLHTVIKILTDILARIIVDTPCLQLNRAGRDECMHLKE